MIDQPDIQEMHRRLEDELTRLQDRGFEDKLGAGGRSGANLDRDDLAHNYSNRERQIALRDGDLARKRQIEEALQRIEEDTYGLCVRCGQPIDKGRLAIIPYAVYCIRCRQAEEQA